MASGVFFGFSPASSAPAPGALTGVNVSSVLIHFGMLASLSSRGRPRHCLTPTSSSSRTPSESLRTLTHVAGSPESLAPAPLETARTIAPTIARPTIQPVGRVASGTRSWRLTARIMGLKVEPWTAADPSSHTPSSSHEGSAGETISGDALDRPGRAREKTRFAGLFQAAEGTRTLDLLHG